MLGLGYIVLKFRSATHRNEELGRHRGRRGRKQPLYWVYSGLKEDEYHISVLDLDIVRSMFGSMFGIPQSQSVRIHNLAVTEVS